MEELFQLNNYNLWFYAYLRGNIVLKFQVSCNFPRQVAGPYKTILELAKIGMSYWQKVTYSLTSMTLSYKRDYTITEDSVSITTFSHGRKTYKIYNYPYAKNFFGLLGNLKLLKS